MNHIMVVCDKEQDYASKLVDYLNLKEGFPFDVRYFSESDILRAFVEKQMVDVILCSEEYLNDMEGIEGVKLIVLQESESYSDAKVERLWKYQSCEKMIKELMKILSGSSMVYSFSSRRKAMKLIGLYSPVKRCLQTTLGILLGQHLAKKGKSLYISLESHSVISEVLDLPFQKDLSDILYALNGNIKNGKLYLESVVMEAGGMDVLPPMNNQSDLLSITPNEWIDFLKKLEQQTDYEYVILDLSDGVQGIEQILRHSNIIYQVKNESFIADKKIQKYQAQMIQSGYEDVVNRIRFVSVIDYKSFPETINRIKNTEFGDLVKELLKEEIYASE